jgi:site-specific recombinase XerD
MYLQVNDDSRTAQQTGEPCDTVMVLVKEFATAMEQERGLSTSTIERTRSAAEYFLAWCEQQHVGMSEIRIRHVDEYLALKGRQGWARSSVRTQAQWLRCFLRYAESRGWSGKGVADAIMTPRIYQQENLPAGPTWEQVQSLIASAAGERASAIRDRAILMLLSVYGLRSGDVTRLRLEDLDWDRETLEVTHPKHRRARQYPLVHSVGEAILDYLQKVRPRCEKREVFLTLRRPFRPLTQVALWHVVGVRLRKLGATAAHVGPHCLRHACAAHLLAEDFSLKAIADQLGHRSLNITRTYAKVDVMSLRSVADFDLGGLR